MKKLIEFNNVTKIHNSVHGRTKILEDITFTINEGELVIITGTRTSGIYTLYKLLAGLDKPSDGEIYVKNEEISSYTDYDLAQFRSNNIGLAIQASSFIPNLTLYENIDLIQDNSSIDINPLQIIQDLGLFNYENKYPNYINNIEQNNMFLIKALTNKDIILCEQSALNTSRQLLTLLKEEINYQNKTVILITEDEKLLTQADKIIFIEKGSIKNILDKKGYAYETIIKDIAQCVSK